MASERDPSLAPGISGSIQGCGGAQAQGAEDDGGGLGERAQELARYLPGTLVPVRRRPERSGGEVPVQSRPTGRNRSRGAAIVDGATESVAVVASRTEAELIVGLLRSHGLSAAVSADDAGGQYPQMQMDGVRVLVAPADEASARRLLAAADGTLE
jgi:hypothetical protein